VRVLDEVPPKWRPLFELLAATGLRISEAIGLRWSDLVLDGPAPHLQVRRAIVKGATVAPKSRHGARLIPLTPELAAAARAHRPRNAADDAFVFPGRDGGASDQGSLRRRVLIPAAECAGLTGVGFHTLRLHVRVDAHRVRTEPAAPAALDGTPLASVHARDVRAPDRRRPRTSARPARGRRRARARGDRGRLARQHRLGLAELHVSAARARNGARGPAAAAHRRRGVRAATGLDPAFVRWLWSFRRSSSRDRFDAGVRALLALNRRTLELFDAYRDAGVRFETHTSGLVVAARTPGGLDVYRKIFQRLRELGYEGGTFDELDGASLASLEPALDPARVVAGLHVRVDRFVRPQELTAGLAERLRADGSRSAKAASCARSSGGMTGGRWRPAPGLP
jgi:hypothetical protein